jgi:hypothetical protein
MEARRWRSRYTSALSQLGCKMHGEDQGLPFVGWNSSMVKVRHQVQPRPAAGMGCACSMCARPVICACDDVACAVFDMVSGVLYFQPVAFCESVSISISIWAASATATLPAANSRLQGARNATLVSISIDTIELESN